MTRCAPRVTTHFRDDKRGTGNDVWLAWHYFAHGNRGMIGWVEGWFEADGRPLPWLERFAPTLRELGGGPGMQSVEKMYDEKGEVSFGRHVMSTGELTWEAFNQAWWRVVRRIVLGNHARDDDQLTDEQQALRRVATAARERSRRPGDQGKPRRRSCWSTQARRSMRGKALAGRLR